MLRPLIVIHESEVSYQDTLSYCQSDLLKESYHTLINTDGGITYLADASRKCYAAGPSSYKYYEYGIEVKESVNDSVDPFSYHVCLISPVLDRTLTEHSGYTNEQYYSLAWLISRTGLSWDRVTLHKLVDDTQTVRDPRSFEPERLHSLWASISHRKTIWFGLNNE